MPYWVTLQGGKKGCVELIDDRDVIKLVWEVLGKEVLSYSPIPYPASPRLITKRDEEGTMCPSFCYTPEICKGSTCCHKNPSCVE